MLLEEARKVIDEEARGLRLLARNMPKNFINAIDIIYKSRGRLVVSGIGKSGHIGKKISSTMSSTGQKSFFLHPSEAHHGDLGMIDKTDVLMFISYSGESLELIPVIEYTKRIGAKTISLTGNVNSVIAQNTDISLELPHIREAYPSIGCIPTVSSTMTLALGDAMAIALLAKRGFNTNDFKNLHPGGAIGHRLMFVHEMLHKDNEMPIVSDSAMMGEAIIVMSEKGLGCVAIVNAKLEMIGIITDGDLRRHMTKNLLCQKVTEVMTKNPICISANIMLAEALHIMEDNKITCLFALDKDKTPIGCIHIHDILKRKVV